MTKKQIIHALRIVDDMHRIKSETRPAAVIPIRSTVVDVSKAMSRRGVQ